MKEKTMITVDRETNRRLNILAANIGCAKKILLERISKVSIPEIESLLNAHSPIRLDAIEEKSEANIPSQG